jgi:hypothetical protein
VSRLYAIDANEQELDFLEVSVLELDNLRMENSIGDAVGGPVEDPTYHEIWTFNASVETWFWVTPYRVNGPLMGILEYGLTTDGVIDDYFVEGTDPVKGFYKLNAPAGEYWISLTADNGTPLDVLFQVQ